MAYPITVVVVPVTGDIHTTTTNSADESLDTLQRIVGGYIEVFDTADGNCAVINEEGKLHGLPLNSRATHALKGNLFSGDYISGDLALIGPPTDDGESTSANLEAAQKRFGPIA